MGRGKKGNFEMTILGKIKNFILDLVERSRNEKKVPIIIPIEREELLKGKTILITGGTGGVGFSIAKACIKSGAKVVIASRSIKKLKEATNQILSENIFYIQLDIQNIGTFEQKILEAENLANSELDILINCAGVNSQNDFFHTTEDEYDSIMDVNQKGTYFMCQAMANYMIKHGKGGHILNVSSSSALRPAWTPYQMSKWAIRGFTQGLADTLFPYGIIVNAIAPGQTATAMLNRDASDLGNSHTVAQRYLIPEEVAALAVYLVSGAGDMVIGDTFYITGGSGTISLHR